LRRSPSPATDPNLAAFVAGLRDLGYVEGRNLALEYRSSEGRPERARELAVQVVSLKPDVIVVLGGDMVPFVKEATSTIPVVMLTSQDPVEAGVVASFARPGGNLTGVAFVSSETAGKRLQFLKESRPRIVEFANKQRIPLVTGWGPWVRSGGFLSYGRSRETRREPRGQDPEGRQARGSPSRAAH